VCFSHQSRAAADSLWQPNWLTRLWTGCFGGREKWALSGERQHASLAKATLLKALQQLSQVVSGPFQGGSKRAPVTRMDWRAAKWQKMWPTKMHATSNKINQFARPDLSPLPRLDHSNDQINPTWLPFRWPT